MEEEKKTSEVVMGTLYDVNKIAVNQEKVLSKFILSQKKDLIKQFIYMTKNNFYMLLSNEKKDYTIFTLDIDNDKYTYEDKAVKASKVLVDECLINRGDIKGIDKTEDGNAIEIWLTIDGDSYVYYFFPYDTAIINVTEELDNE